MKEEWLFPNAVVPVDVETTSELVAEIKRLIDVVGGMALAQQEPVDGTQVSKVWWGVKLMAKPIPLEDIYQPVDWKAEYLKSVESGCITLDELREANAELAATNRQVEILSDALAESQRQRQSAQRQWVGLTHDEYDAICDKHSAMSDFDFLEDIETKLREKNAAAQPKQEEDLYDLAVKADNWGQP